MIQDFKVHDKTVVWCSTVWCWHKNRHTDQWNRTESPEIDLHIYGINLWQRNKDYKMAKGQCLQWMLIEKLNSHTQKNATGTLSDTIHKNYLKVRIKCLNVIPKTIKLMEENIGGHQSLWWLFGYWNIIWHHSQMEHYLTPSAWINT